MMTLTRSTGLLAAAIAAAVLIATPASARPWHRHHGWHGGGAGAAIGFATGALIGGALASRPYYGNGPYAYGGGPYVVDDGYAAGGDVQYCMQRFRSYNPSTGTYRGFDGLDHPCP